MYRPLRYGQLNSSQFDKEHSNLSRTTLLSMLEDLWTKAIEEYLQIDKKDFKV